MTEFIESLRNKQRVLAREYAGLLLAEEGAAGSFKNPGIDPTAIADMLTEKLEDMTLGCFKAIVGSSDYVACEIIRSQSWEPRPFPIGDEIAYAVADKQRMPGELVLVGKVIHMMSETEGELPLLGVMSCGCLIPNQGALQVWGSFYEF